MTENRTAKSDALIRLTTIFVVALAGNAYGHAQDRTLTHSHTSVICSPADTCADPHIHDDPPNINHCGIFGSHDNCPSDVHIHIGDSYYYHSHDGISDEESHCDATFNHGGCSISTEGGGDDKKQDPNPIDQKVEQDPVDIGPTQRTELSENKDQEDDNHNDEQTEIVHSDVFSFTELLYRVQIADDIVVGDSLTTVAVVNPPEEKVLFTLRQATSIDTVGRIAYSPKPSLGRFTIYASSGKIKAGRNFSHDEMPYAVEVKAISGEQTAKAIVAFSYIDTPAGKKAVVRSTSWGEIKDLFLE